MKVICKQTTSAGFDFKEVTTINSNNFDYTFGGSGIELGKEYLVMGMACYKDSKCIYYLIDTNGIPDWFPYLLFKISDCSLAPNWFIKINENNNTGNEIYSLCGFDELCNIENFYDRLLDRERSALEIYFKQKMEMEKALAEENELS